MENLIFAMQLFSLSFRCCFLNFFTLYLCYDTRTLLAVTIVVAKQQQQQQQNEPVSRDAQFIIAAWRCIYISL